jgi:16S rRNA (adenine1518-N6/adenine1519-N6)-dimethyltransferase
MSARKPVNAAHRKAPLGQNFLVDASAARRIAEALGNAGNSPVIEIGAGRGALTRLLAARAARLIAIELDEMLARQLKDTYAGQPNIEIVQANFLRVSVSELLSAETRLPQRAKVVGNIPYYITSDILLHLLEQHKVIELAVLMVQKEVADRLVAQPGSRDYGLLTVTTQLFAEVERLFTIPPSAFSPPPKVYSTVVRLRVNPQAERLGVDPESFLQFCKNVFSHKRKTLFNNLRGRFEQQQIKRALGSVGAGEQVRAEALSLEQLAKLYKHLQQANAC